MDEPDTAAAIAEERPDALEPALRAFEVGDYAQARRLAAALQNDDDESIRRRASALLEKLGSDHVIVGVMALTGFLIAVLAALYVGAR